MSSKSNLARSNSFNPNGIRNQNCADNDRLKTQLIQLIKVMEKIMGWLKMTLVGWETVELAYNKPREAYFRL
ncbi:hypothetical protein [Prosthecobacter sp.]|uniref:hypothetical protein n=1 Tax=Prosthecobacter sp. TaxID=1965333 RepID=UPI0025E81BC5|nr:hypothetical protein [Prosthecobacter sp.]